MPRDATVQVPFDTIVELSNSEAISSEVYIQNRGISPVTLLATSTATAPTKEDFLNKATVELQPGEAWNDTLAKLFRGVAAPTRLWALNLSAPGGVSVGYQ